MKIAFITATPGVVWGGSEELWSQAALRLRAAGHQVFASVGPRMANTRQVKELISRGIEITVHKNEHQKIAARVWNKLQRAVYTPELRWLKNLAPDLTVISQGSSQGGIVWMRHAASLGLCYATIVQANSDLWYPVDPRVGEMHKAYQAAKRVFCVSQHNLDLLSCQIGESLPNARVVWNPYGCRPQDELPWPTDDGRWRLACVARLEISSKGQDILFKALAKPHWRNQPIEINLYGQGGHEQALRRLAKYLGLECVRFHGHVDDLEKVWEANHALLLPSRHEGLPLALVEAMWCGRPAIVTDAGGNAELCVDGSTGFVSPAVTVKHLDETLQRAWQNRHLWQTMGQASRRRAEELVPRDPIGEFCDQLIPGLVSD